MDQRVSDREPIDLPMDLTGRLEEEFGETDAGALEEQEGGQGCVGDGPAVDVLL